MRLKKKFIVLDIPFGPTFFSREQSFYVVNSTVTGHRSGASHQGGCATLATNIRGSGYA
jgi:hypothetical protein